jgi:hypothetical protein
MKGAKVTLPNNRRFALVPRSGSYSIIWQSIPTSDRNPSDGWHPINATGDTIGSPLAADEPADGLCCLVRDPVERFRSACARQGVSVEEGLERQESDVHFWTLDSMGLLEEGVTHFRFPDQIDACAEWLGLEAPVPQLNQEEEASKPTLTEDQAAAIRIAYAADVAIWESLHQFLPAGEK